MRVRLQHQPLVVEVIRELNQRPWLKDIEVDIQEPVSTRKALASRLGRLREDLLDGKLGPEEYRILKSGTLATFSVAALLKMVVVEEDTFLEWLEHFEHLVRDVAGIRTELRMSEGDMIVTLRIEAVETSEFLDIFGLLANALLYMPV